MGCREFYSHTCFHTAVISLLVSTCLLLAGQDQPSVRAVPAHHLPLPEPSSTSGLSTGKTGEPAGLHLLHLQLGESLSQPTDIDKESGTTPCVYCSMLGPMENRDWVGGSTLLYLPPYEKVPSIEISWLQHCLSGWGINSQAYPGTISENILVFCGGFAICINILIGPHLLPTNEAQFGEVCKKRTVM